MSEPKCNTLRRGLVVAAIVVMSAFIAFGRLPPDGFPFQEFDAEMHFAGFATISLLAVLAWPRAALSRLLAGLVILAGITELLQFIPSLNRTPSWSDFGFNISGIATMLGVIAALHAKAHRR